MFHQFRSRTPALGRRALDTTQTSLRDTCVHALATPVITRPPCLRQGCAPRGVRVGDFPVPTAVMGAVPRPVRRSPETPSMQSSDPVACLAAFVFTRHVDQGLLVLLSPVIGLVPGSRPRPSSSPHGFGAPVINNVSEHLSWPGCFSSSASNRLKMSCRLRL